ncbi:GNAT family N-acetyltransferase [Pikeienuella piscinae]|uniref:GNAT family N-acetyltransferase n=1 Tax=Pikeienuella piscinae TaxID=2748098 RepID=A0A7M3T774_9RHOB|nr:GNAT family N-acetyltransferase [Pikeienuella piscinae]
METDVAPTPDRLQRLAKVHETAFGPLERGWSATEIGNLAKAGLLVSAKDDSGFALLSLAADEVELLTLAVAPERRRAGLGATILDAALIAAAASGGAAIHLEVAADNAPALALYRNAGFTQTGRRPRYYLRGASRIDALVLSRNL